MILIGTCNGEANFKRRVLYFCGKMCDRKYNSIVINYLYATTHLLRGAEEACWAHNPKVLGSKPSGAKVLFSSGLTNLHVLQIEPTLLQ